MDVIQLKRPKIHPMCSRMRLSSCRQDELGYQMDIHNINRGGAMIAEVRTSEARDDNPLQTAVFQVPPEESLRLNLDHNDHKVERLQVFV